MKSIKIGNPASKPVTTFIPNGASSGIKDKRNDKNNENIEEKIWNGINIYKIEYINNITVIL